MVGAIVSDAPSCVLACVPQIVPTALLVSGALCVILGFVAVNLGGQYNGPKKENPKPPPRKSSELGVLHSP